MSDSATKGIKTVLHPVTDLAAAKAVYTALFGAHQTPTVYVGFEAGGQRRVPGGGPQGMSSPVTFWEVSDIEAKPAEVTAAQWQRQGGRARCRRWSARGHLHRSRRQRPWASPGPMGVVRRHPHRFSETQ